MTDIPGSDTTSRRDFLKTTTVVAGTAVAAHLFTPGVHAAENNTIKVGVIGCGGRGSGAAENVMHSAPGVEIVALGDYFQDKASGLRNRLMRFAQNDEQCKKLGNKVSIPDEACYGGVDAYQKVIDSGANYIILATPPGFRPQHLQAAVAAGKNIFTEKPVGVDGAGIRKVLDAYEEAKKKKLAIVAGTQRRHQAGYLETMKQVANGAIGEITALRCYWNQGNIWFRDRKSGMTDLDYQINNWYHFMWLCGDHIVEQHVHNLDVCNWAMGGPPARAVGMGGRTRPYNDPKVDGNIFNFFAIDFEYPNGVHMLSMARQINDCENSVSEALVGTKGTCQPNQYRINGKSVFRGRGIDPYVQEHTDLIASIRKGEPLNELKTVAESTLTAIMGRMSAYTGKAVTFDFALKSRLDTFPPKLSRDMSLPVADLPVPGKTELI